LFHPLTKSDFALPSLYVFYGIQENSQAPPFSAAAGNSPSLYFWDDQMGF
jgi:hypothetical protein